jgi:hypothetical protein
MALFLEVPQSLGFDPNGPWLMVGENDVQYVQLLAGPHAVLTFQSGASKVARVVANTQPKASAPRVVGIRGLKPGRDTLLVKDPGSGRSGKLEVEVLPARKLTVQFYPLSDRAGHHTVRNCAEAGSMLKRAHSIHFHQDRVCLLPGGCEPLHMNGDLGNQPSTSFLFNLFESMFRTNTTFHRQLHRCKADFHVFLIWDMKDDLGLEPGDGDDPGGGGGGGGGRPLGVTRPPSVICFIRDFRKNEDDPGVVLAHEVGHFLTPNNQGSKMHSSDRKNLMFPVAVKGVSGVRLTHDQCLTMNGNAGLHWILFPPCPPPAPKHQPVKPASR